MKYNKNNFAYIDGANLHRGVKELGWKLDYKKLRVWLDEKYGVKKAYIFIGFISQNTRLYRDFQNWGYIVVFKPIIPFGDGEIKGNCDAELVLQTVSDMYEKTYDKAIIVSGDGDFACLVTFLQEKERFSTLICPNYKKASALLRNAVSGEIIFLNEFKQRLQYAKEGRKEKAPVRDGTRM
ncbi:MAG: NYN domain-containing protein [Candidatus Parcubacteria bacterium]|nr:NYN domain-containing protein [Candidatus Parcubacteria bacterium]